MLNYKEIIVKNSSKIEYTMNKNHSSINYHLVCKNVPAGASDNIAEALTKRLKGTKRKKLFSDWTY